MSKKKVTDNKQLRRANEILKAQLKDVRGTSTLQEVKRTVANIEENVKSAVENTLKKKSVRQTLNIKRIKKDVIKTLGFTTAAIIVILLLKAANVEPSLFFGKWI